VGSEDQIPVIKKANIVAEEMGLENVKFTCRGGVDGGRGWKGLDSLYQLIHRIKQHFWAMRFSEGVAIQETVAALSA
jgi:hypothetical protein